MNLDSCVKKAGDSWCQVANGEKGPLFHVGSC